MRQFYLGIHEPAWMPRTDVPLCVSDHRLTRRVALPRAAGPWILDSGGFTAIATHGRHIVDHKTYAGRVRRYAHEIGNLAAASTQDWMCEPAMLARTGHTIAEHQTRTIHSYLELREHAPDLPWIPVLQGWAQADYLHHREHYGRAGVELRTLPMVGVGSICRRQATTEAAQILRAIDLPNLHAFGLKTIGLIKAQDHIATADSMAWSYQARKRAPLPGHTHAACQNCLEYALRWRTQLLTHAHKKRAASPASLP